MPWVRAQALVLPLTAYHGGVVEGELPGGEGKGFFPGEGLQIGGHPLALGFVGTEKNHRAARLLPQSGGEVGPVGGGKAADRRRGAARIQGGQKLLKFRNAL